MLRRRSLQVSSHCRDSCLRAAPLPPRFPAKKFEPVSDLAAQRLSPMAGWSADPVSHWRQRSPGRVLRCIGEDLEQLMELVVEHHRKEIRRIG